MTTTARSVTYTPNANFNGTDTFTYTITDGNGGSDLRHRDRDGRPVNDAPVAVDDTATMDEDQADTSSRPGQRHRCRRRHADRSTSATDGANGTVTDERHLGDLHAERQLQRHRHVHLHDLRRQRRHRHGDRHGDGRPVNDAPVAIDDAPRPTRTRRSSSTCSPTTPMSTATPDGDRRSPAAPTARLTTNGDGTVTYSPNADFTGTDTFTYTISDGNGGTATGTVTVDGRPGQRCAGRRTRQRHDRTRTHRLTYPGAGQRHRCRRRHTDRDRRLPRHPTARRHQPIRHRSPTRPNADFNGTDTSPTPINDGNGGTTPPRDHHRDRRQRCPGRRYRHGVTMRTSRSPSPCSPTTPISTTTT